jgi:hypothetical protein
LEFDPDKVDLSIESAEGKLKLVENGMAADYSEEIATKILSGKEVKATADLNPAMLPLPHGAVIFLTIMSRSMPITALNILYEEHGYSDRKIKGCRNARPLSFKVTNFLQILKYEVE